MRFAYQIDVSVIIVSYNSTQEISRCLDSLLTAGPGLNLEVIVIDNHSSDATLQRILDWQDRHVKDVPRFRLVSNADNVGFTRAVNQGLAQANGRLLLLLNPDTELCPGSLKTLVTFLDHHSDVGLAAPQLRFANGAIQPSVRRFPLHRDVYCELVGFGRLFPGHPIFNRWKMAGFDHRSTQEVDQPQGACMLIPRAVFDMIGPLDDRFHMFFSDVDLCLRIKKAGWRIIFLADVFVFHHKGRSIYAKRERMVVSSHRSFVQYFDKHFTTARYRGYNRLLQFSLLVALLPRILFIKLLSKS